MTATFSHLRSVGPQAKLKQPPKPTLHNRLNATSSCRCIRQFRSQVKSVYELGGKCPSAVIRFLHARLDQGLGDPDQQEEAEMLLALAWQQATKPEVAKRILRAQASASDTSPEAVQARMDEKAAVLAARRQEQLAQDPYAHVRNALERVAAAKPATAAATQASAPAAAGPRKRAPRGTCCPRELERPLTLLLQQIRHHEEDEADWGPMEEFPWELANETLKELQTSRHGTPGRGNAAEAAPCATVALEAEPSTGPLPVQLPPDDATAAGEAALAALSPRARAIAELGAALLQGGQRITISTGAAAELLEALV